MTAGDVMDASAALLNDRAKSRYTYVAQLPYLKMALAELRELFELNNIPSTNQTSAVLTLPASTTVVSFTSVPALPAGLIEIQQLWESQSGTGKFSPMAKKEFIPHYLEGRDVSSFMIWAWISQEIRLLSADRPNDLKIDYIQELFGNVVDQNSAISTINAQSFLNFKTASLCAYYIGENETRSIKLDGEADDALYRSLGISNKAKQSMVVRRRPFRSSYKSRGF